MTREEQTSGIGTEPHTLEVRDTRDPSANRQSRDDHDDQSHGVPDSIQNSLVLRPHMKQSDPPESRDRQSGPRTGFNDGPRGHDPYVSPPARTYDDSGGARNDRYPAPVGTESRDYMRPSRYKDDHPNGWYPRHPYNKHDDSRNSSQARSGPHDERSDTQGRSGRHEGVPSDDQTRSGRHEKVPRPISRASWEGTDDDADKPYLRREESPGSYSPHPGRSQPRSGARRSGWYPGRTQHEIISDEHDRASRYGDRYIHDRRHGVSNLPDSRSRSDKRRDWSVSPPISRSPSREKHDLKSITRDLGRARTARQSSGSGRGSGLSVDEIDVVRARAKRIRDQKKRDSINSRPRRKLSDYDDFISVGATVVNLVARAVRDVKKRIGEQNGRWDNYEDSGSESDTGRSSISIGQ